MHQQGSSIQRRWTSTLLAEKLQFVLPSRLSDAELLIAPCLQVMSEVYLKTKVDISNT